MATLSSIIGTNFSVQGIKGDQGIQGVQGVQGALTIAQNQKTSSYQLVATDNGKHISISDGNITVPQNVFSVGDVITIFNNNASTDRTIIQGTNTTLRLAGTSLTGNRILSPYGVCTILCVASNVFVISGAGLS